MATRNNEQQHNVPPHSKSEHSAPSKNDPLSIMNKKMVLCVSVDVEPDCSKTWNYTSPLKFSGIHIGIKERLHPLFRKYHIHPTFLINNVVLEDDDSVRTLAKLDGHFELGTHLHPEFIEPQKSIYNYAGSKGEANCNAFNPEIEQEKIANITRLFIKCFHYSPKSFRAGRFSAGKNTIRSLAKLGYLVDSSVTPHICWNDPTREHPVDYKSTLEQPYWTSSKAFPCPVQDIESEILEIPITIKNMFQFTFRDFLTSGFGLKRPYSFFKAQWLRPIYSSYAQLNNIIESSFSSKIVKSNPIVVNMMFHNVEVLPALSPYTNSESDCNSYLGILESFFMQCSLHGIESKTLSEIYDSWK
jgi:hypothetical protein